MPLADLLQWFETLQTMLNLIRSRSKVALMVSLVAWMAGPGEHELCVRATDASGRTQALDGEEVWNQGGYGINVVQRVFVKVG